jgi:hypothetical protein
MMSPNQITAYNAESSFCLCRVPGSAARRFGGGRALCGSTVWGARSRYVFMTPVLQGLLAQDGCGSPREINGAGASPASTPCLFHGARPFTRGNPRLLRRVDTTFAFIESHPV